MKPFPKKYKHTDAETQWQARWAEDDAFKWSPDAPAETDYVIDTPPPTVSGTLHVGHVYSYTQADIMARYMRMSGRNVLYPIGWDDNGLPTERLVEKVKKVRGGNMSREEFVALCKEVIPPYEDEFRNLFSRLALSVDWSREYQTISDESRKVSQLSFLDLYRKGLLERRLEPTLWDPADRTAIAQAEVEEIEREGKLNQIPFEIEGGELEPAIIATSRPELIGACGGLMIHPEHPRAKELVGKNAISPLYGVPIPIYAEDTVDPEKGTGIVMCCTFGDVTDIQWYRKHKLPLRVVIDEAGKMKSDLAIGSEGWPSKDVEAAQAIITQLAGLKAEKAKEAILEILKERGLILKQDVTHQVVPVAERSGAPLEIIVTPQWFIKTLDYKDQILEKAREITWRPEYMRQRLESWVEGLKWDWGISRQRHFGVSIPVWYSKRPGEEGKIIVPSPDQLPVDPTSDLPEGYSADDVIGEKDVLDTWATSSVSPQLVTRTVSEDLGKDYETHKRLFPMAMRPQAHEIIRTWAFYTIVKALHHGQSVPWNNISISGWCLASDGSKMSKSKGNVIDPIKLLDEYGSDVVRYWTGTSRLGHDTALSPNTLAQGKRLVTKLWNAIKLAHMAWEQVPEGALAQPSTVKADFAAGLISHPMDQWMLGHLSETVAKATEAFEKYEYAQALRHVEDFFWRIHCDNYLEIVKRRTRFEGVPDAEQTSALYALFHASATITKLFAPFMPFVTETLHDVLWGEGDNAIATIHARGSWPKAEDFIAPDTFRREGDNFVSILAAGRKVKSELQVSMKAPVEVMEVAGLRDSDPNESLARVMGDTALDMEAVMSTQTIVWAHPLSEGLPRAASPDNDFEVALKMAPQEPKSE
ncbi:valine--tRNA ligase [Woodsholea maritima]|uniref:valine--tRNA ligase n=1 Tax=Woodsholea maritima TaxID=240237 RepID=UPI00037FBC35|nr:valine--tRNA ligase [Woodsholea maritima]